MKDLLEQIQNVIDENLDQDVNVQMTLLEPLFFEAYANCHNSQLDIKDMLKLSQLENQLTKRIIDVNPKIEPSININEEDKTIEQIIYYSRRQAEAIYHCSLASDSLRSRSLDFCNIVLETSKNLGVPACMFNLGQYFNWPIKHYIVIAYLNSNYYLIDITYQQFFLLGYNFRDRYYEHPSYTRVCEVGRRIVDKDYRCAAKMIESGYLKEESDIKKYFDTFMEMNDSDKLDSGNEYLKILLDTLKGSSDKNERLLYSKMNF